jgi:hypothetical protein
VRCAKLWPTRFRINIHASRAGGVVKQPRIEVRWVGTVVGLDQKRFGGAYVTVRDREIHSVRSGDADWDSAKPETIKRNAA